MSFRDDLGAAQARNDALARRVAELEAENRELRGEPESKAGAPGPLPPPKRPGVLVVFAVAGLCAAIAAIAVFAGQPIAAAIAAVVGLLLCAQILVLRSVLHIVGPEAALVLSGRRHVAFDGTVRGYRVITAGRAVAIPLLESAARLDLRDHPVSARIANAYSKGNVPVDIELAAEVHIARDAPVIHAAIERFLGRDMSEVTRVAKETIEGATRGLVSSLTLEEMQQDSEKLSEAIISECDSSMRDLGLVLDRLSVVAVRVSS